MYNTYILIGAVLVLAALLIHFKPRAIDEGFAVRAVDLNMMPECVSRSTDAQNLLMRFSSYPESNTDAAELRNLVSKLCCMEADIMSPSAGTYRTIDFQFRTSEDMEPPATIVGRCLRNAVNRRDIDLMMEKFTYRGHQLVEQLCPPDERAAGIAEFDKVVAHLKFAMTSFCLKEQPHMDRPVGARDMGFWEPENVADLSQYQGISSSPK